MKKHLLWILVLLVGAVGWVLLDGDTPASVVPPTVDVTVAEVGDSHVVVSWRVTPGSEQVTGVRVGHGGPDKDGNDYESPLRPELSGTQRLGNLVNGTRYAITVTPVVDGARDAAAAVRVTGTPAPPDTGPVPSAPSTGPRARHMTGIYDGGAQEDADVKATFGHWGQVQSGYIAHDFANWKPDLEAARLQRHHVLLTWHARDTQWIADAAGVNGPAAREAADALGDSWADKLVWLAQQAPPGRNVYATIAHEHDVYSNPDRSDVSYLGASGDPTTFATAYDRWVRRASARAAAAGVTNLELGVWFGGFRTDHVGAVLTRLAALGTPVDWISEDPYVNSPGDESAAQSFGAVVARYRSDTGPYRDAYTALGSPPLAVSEHGISKSTHTDAEMRDYYDGVRAAVVSLDLLFAVQFNRDSGPQGKHRVDDGRHPLARAAVARMLAP